MKHSQQQSSESPGPLSEAQLMPPGSGGSMRVTCTSPDSQDSHVSPPGSPSLPTSSESERPSQPPFTPLCQARSPQGPPFCTPRSPLPATPGPPHAFQAPPPLHPHLPIPAFQLHSSSSLDLWVLFLVTLNVSKRQGGFCPLRNPSACTSGEVDGPGWPWSSVKQTPEVQRL